MNNTELRVERLRQGFTQKELAREIGISENAYFLKESKKREFSRCEIYKICKVLNIDLQRMNEIFFDGKLTECIS